MAVQLIGQFVGMLLEQQSSSADKWITANSGRAPGISARWEGAISPQLKLHFKYRSYLFGYFHDSYHIYSMPLPVATNLSSPASGTPTAGRFHFVRRDGSRTAPADRPDTHSRYLRSKMRHGATSQVHHPVSGGGLPSTIKQYGRFVQNRGASIPRINSPTRPHNRTDRSL